MRTRSQSRNLNRQQQQAPPAFVEPFNLEEPIENPAPPVVTMDDNRTMAQLLEAPTEGYEDAIVVPEITADNFELKHDHFYDEVPERPECGHCKKLAPEWKKAAKNLQGKVKLGHVNCDDEKSLMSRYKVVGFPTILVFGADKESPLIYEGARSASAIESFALILLETNVAPPEVTKLTSPDVMERRDCTLQCVDKDTSSIVRASHGFVEKPFSRFAFVYFEDERDVEEAINALDNTTFGYDKRKLSVEWARV
ncbi:disulfide isomerase-like protein 2-3 [Tanacetum coccineum]